MKANRKFISAADEAVSPVIAVILMVAITVVLAATVYVWVSGFGQNGSQPKTASFSATSSGGVATLTLVSAAPNLEWNKVKVVVDGATGYGILIQGSGFSSYMNDAAWVGSTALSSTTRTAGPGDTIKFGVDTTPTSAVRLNIVDTSANTVIATVTVPSLTGITAVSDGIASCDDSDNTITFTTSTNGYYSKTGTDSALVQPGNLLITATPLTTGTHAGIAGLTFTNTEFVDGNTLNFDANEIFDIGGNALTGTQACVA